MCLLLFNLSIICLDFSQSFLIGCISLMYFTPSVLLELYFDFQSVLNKVFLLFELCSHLDIVLGISNNYLSLFR